MNNPFQDLKRPSVDVVIPVFNGERFISEALSSVFAQTYAPTNVILVDDGSTDNTEGAVRSFFDRTPLRYLKRRNGGLSSARNAGIANCTGQYVAFLDADDVWEPSKIEEQVAIFSHSPSHDLGAVYCGIRKVDASGKFIGQRSFQPFKEGGRGRILDRLIRSNCITGSASSIMIRRDCFSTIGLFDESLPSCEDWDLWLRLALQYQFDFVDEPLVKIREHGNNMSTNTERMVVGRILVLSKLLKSGSNNRVILQELRYQVLRLAVCRKLKLTRYTLEEYLEPPVVTALVANPLGMVYALFTGLSKLSSKSIEVRPFQKKNCPVRPARSDTRSKNGN